MIGKDINSIRKINETIKGENMFSRLLWYTICIFYNNTIIKQLFFLKVRIE